MNLTIPNLNENHGELVSLRRLFLRRNVSRKCRASFRAWHFR